MDPFRDFARSPNQTLGVEWEICLVDPVTRGTVTLGPNNDFKDVVWAKDLAILTFTPAA